MSRNDAPGIVVTSTAESWRADIESALAPLNCRFLSSSNHSRTKDLVTNNNVALLIFDIRDESEIEDVSSFCKNELIPNVPIIFITPADLLQIDAFKDFAESDYDCIFRPVNDNLLRVKTRHFLEVYTLKRTLEQEVRKRQEAIATLSDEKRYTESLINSSTDMIISVDMKRRIFEFNKRAEEVFGYTKDEVLGKPVDMLYAYLDQSWCVYENTIKNDRYSVEVINRKKSGELFPSLISTSVLVERSGKILGTMGISRDITEQKRTQTALRDAKNKAETADQAKSEFLTHMSHELRTPMTSIIGYAELLRDALGNQQDYLDLIDTIERNGRHLMRIINEILDLSRAERGKLTIERSWCQPYLLVRDVYDLLIGRSTEQRVTLKTEIRGQIPESINSDPTRILQCLINIIGNAVKFTPRNGKVVVVAEYLSDADKPMLAFEVTDTGIGIPPDQLKNIMKPFEQGGCAIPLKYGGTGLGLTITKRLAQLLGGDLTVESEVGTGSSFRLTIDCGVKNESLILSDEQTLKKNAERVAAERKSEIRPGTYKLRGRILIAEDNEDIQNLLTKFIVDAGGTVEIAGTGTDAYEKAINEPYDLVVLDMDLPEMDGKSVIKKLRLEGFIRPVIGLTAAGTEDDLKRFLDSGCDDCAVKPISRLEFIKLLRTWLKCEKSNFIIDTLMQQTQSGASNTEIKRTVDNTSPIFSTYHNDPSMNDIIAGYVVALPGKLDGLLAALEANELSSFKTIAHGLHGSGGGFGFAVVSELGEELESLVKTNADSNEIHSALEKLKHVIERISRAYG